MSLFSFFHGGPLDGEVRALQGDEPPKEIIEGEGGEYRLFTNEGPTAIGGVTGVLYTYRWEPDQPASD